MRSEKLVTKLAFINLRMVSEKSVRRVLQTPLPRWHNLKRFGWKDDEMLSLNTKTADRIRLAKEILPTF